MKRKTEECISLCSINTLVITDLAKLLPFKEKYKILASHFTHNDPMIIRTNAVQSVAKKFDVVLNERICRIHLTVLDNKKTYAWTLMPRNMMEADMSVYSYTNEYYYGISDVSKIVPESVSLLHSLRTFMAGDVDTITLSADIFNDDQSAVTNAQVISQIGRCKTLRVDGTVGIGTCSRVFLNQGCTILLNKLQISEKINIRDVYPDASINLSKISHIPYTEYCLSSVTPINLLNCASRETKICVPDFSLSDINLFMKEWLQSPTTNIHRLTLKIKNAEEENIEKMFEGLAHLGIKAPCCSFKTHCTNASCAHQKLIHLKTTGVDLHRSDGAVATVFYSAAVQHFSFVFFVRYPGECSKTRVKEHTRKLDKVLKKHRKVLEELRWLADLRNRIIDVFGGQPEHPGIHCLLLQAGLQYNLASWKIFEDHSISEDIKSLEQMMHATARLRQSF
ncbi:hypothetical protein L5515_016345 [Caenorhabditis briggsae]|uniref:Uncharacterized protein n=1 Tax=Caenorhabditis briggsae TaxID=6238 RepID=A0AAE9FAC4_CAEBR|nr:hypothetical protein L5515_016345 [Caenorhabditis briggsae]